MSVLSALHSPLTFFFLIKECTEDSKNTILTNVLCVIAELF